jgi:CheY-like chemotaxis protein
LKACGESVEEPQEEESLSREVFEGKRILLTEDNELNREIACEILNMAGIEVENAENGEVAVKMFTESDEGYYDLILMDVQMPVMNGYEATEAIRSLDRDDAKCIPIFAMTANAFAEDIHNAEKAGMNEHLAKPLSPERLINTLEKWFTKSCRIVS